MFEHIGKKSSFSRRHCSGSRGGIRHSGPGHRPCYRHTLNVSADRSYRMRQHVSVRRRFVHARPNCRITAIPSPKTAKSSCLRCAVSRRFFRRPTRRIPRPIRHRRPTDSLLKNIAKIQTPSSHKVWIFSCVSCARSARHSFRAPAHMEFLPRSAPSAAFLGSGFWARTRWQEAFSMLAPCASCSEKSHRNEQSQNSLLEAISSGSRSASRSARKKAARVVLFGRA